MVLYTIYPPEVVLQSAEESKLSYFSVDFEGRTFILELVDGQARLVRLISTNPNDYLRPEWQPGTKVGFTMPGTKDRI